MKKFIPLIALMFLTACTEVQLGTHVLKQIAPSEHVKHKGTFKVGNSYKIKGQRYTPFETYDFSQTGIASWYGPDFHGKMTANGEIYDQYALTAAHNTLQMPSIVRVTNLENGKSIIVRINDRGPFARNRIIDMSKRGAELLGFKNQGTARVKVEVLPEESREVAQIAKSGRTTRGMEVAYNRGQKPAVRTAAYTPPSTKINPSPVIEPTQQAYNAPARIQSVNYTTEPVQVDSLVKTYAVKPTELYVQTASFSNQSNALNFANTLRRYGSTKVKEIMINGSNFYRVKLGPLNDVAHADSMLSTLIADGYKDALIVVDTKG